MTSIEVFSTFIQVRGGYDKLRKVVRKLSTIDYATDEIVPFSYEYNGRTDTLKIPRGVGVDTVKDLIPDAEVVYKIPFKTRPLMAQLTAINALNETQANTRASLMEELSKFRVSQAGLVMPTGEGKTWTIISTACEMNVKPIIFVKNNNLREQFIKSIKDFTTARGEDIVVIEHNTVEELSKSNRDISFFILTQPQYTLIMKKPKGMLYLMTLLSKQGVGMKVVDEADIASGNVFHFDFRNNIKWNVYATGTFFKSAAYDNAAFQYSFRTMRQIGQEEYKEHVGNRECYTYFIESKPEPEQAFKCFANNVKRSFIPAQWALYLLNHKKEKLLEFLDAPMTHIMGLMKEAKENGEKVRNLIFIPSIEGCNILREIILQNYNVSHRQVGVYNSEVSNNEKKDMINREIIITTRDSLGRGSDISGVVVSVLIDPHKTKSGNSQVAGRNGRQGGTKGFVYEIVDVSFGHCDKWYRHRKEGYRKIYSNHEEFTLT